MIDLSTTYLGMRLRSPLVAAASPVSRNVELARQLEEAGLGAIVMYSLFEEQIIHNSLELDRMLSHGAESFAEALSYLPEHGVYSVGPERYLEQVVALKKALSIPVIGSLNGVSVGGWVHYARLIQEAGADALELNIYFVPIDTNITSSELENIYIELVRAVRAEISIPLAVKIGPYFTALPNFAWRLMEAGANALVLFNRFYQPDLDLEQLSVRPNLQLSTSGDLRLPLRWIALLYGRIPVEFAISSGVHSAIDALKGLMAGASVATMASALLRGRAPDIVRNVLRDMELWLTEHEYDSIEQLRGSMSQRAVAEPAAFERANYIRVLEDYRPPYAIGSHNDLTGRMLYPFLGDEV